MSYQIIFTDKLYHHGIKGQRWGIRRFRNEDGSLTSAGKKRYDNKSKHRVKLEKKYINSGMSKEEAEQKANKKIKIEKRIAIGSGIAAAGLAAYGAYKYSKFTKDEAANKRIKEGIKSAKWDFDLAKEHRSHAKADRILDEAFEKGAKASWDEKRKIFSGVLDLPKEPPASPRIYAQSAKLRDKAADEAHKKGLEKIKNAYNDAEKFKKSFRESYKYLHK